MNDNMIGRIYDKPVILGGQSLIKEKTNIVCPSIAYYTDQRLIDEIRSILKSNIVTNSEKVKQLEEEISKYLSVKYVVALSSCTLGLTLAIRVLGLNYKEVLLPSFTIAATVNAAYWNNCKIRFVDIDRDTFNISVEDIKAKITKTTKAILGVHIFGNPCEVLSILKIAEKYGIKVIFDAAQTFGSKYFKKSIGGFGDTEIFSASPTKHFTTIEGGFISTNDRNIAEKVKLARNYGILSNYDCIIPGLNARLSEINAAIGLSMLKDLDNFVTNRNRYAMLYKEKLSELPGIGFQKITENSISSYNYFGILIDKRKFGLSNRQLAEALRVENIMTKIYYYPPVHRHTFYKKITTKEKLPNTDYVSQRIICLPIYNFMEEELIDKVCRTIKRIHKFSKKIRLKIKELG